MATLKVSDLSPHPKNNYYFDDVSGEKWNEFLESIRKNGVREQIIVTDDMVIVSGHQRVRACKELGIQVIDAKIEHYNTDDDVIRDLIEINTKQRGVISDSEIKIGRRIKFLQDYYGIKNGRPQKLGHYDQVTKTQDDLAKELEMSKSQMNRYKRLTDLIPELQSAVESGQITATTAMGFVKKLSPEEQKKLADAIGDKDKVSGKEVEKYIIELKSKDAEIERLTRNNETLDRVNKKLAREANQGGKVIEKTVEVVPDDYEEAKRDAEAAKKDFRYAKKQYEEVAEKLRQAEAENQRLIDEKNNPEVQRAERNKVSAFSLATGVSNFLETFGGYTFLMEEVNTLPEKERTAVNNAVNAMYEWASAMLNTAVTEVIE